MKSILLINSPLHATGRGDSSSLPSLGLGYLATQLEHSGIPTQIYDAVALGYNQTLLQKYISNSQYIGLNIFSTNIDLVSNIISSIPSGHQIIIGGLATLPLHEIIADFKTDNIIHIISGEADFAIADIVNNKYIENIYSIKRKRLHYIINKHSVYYPNNLNDVYLDRRLLSNNGIVLNIYGDQEACVLSSRGCIYDCAFCGAAKNSKNQTTARTKDLEFVKAEIDELKKYGIKSVRVLDDLFLRNNSTIENASEMFSDLALQWRAMAHINTFKTATEHIYKSLYAGHCKELFCGIESGSQRIIDYINKKHTPESVLETVGNLLKHGINVKGYFIYGFPNEEYNDMEKTLKLATNLKMISKKTSGNFRASVFKFRPYHGTKIYKDIFGDDIVLNMIDKDDSLTKLNGKENFNFKSNIRLKVNDDIINMFISKTLDVCNRTK